MSILTKKKKSMILGFMFIMAYVYTGHGEISAVRIKDDEES